MRNRSLFIAAGNTQAVQAQQASPQGGMHTPQGGIGTLLQALMGGRGFGSATSRD